MAFLLPPPPDVTELASFIPRIPALLHSEVDAQLRDDQRAPNQGSFSLEDSNQLRVIKSTCDAFNATISDLEDAGKKLDALKNYVTLAKRFATEKLAQHHSLTSPIRKLPNEVLQLIFIEVHAQSTEGERRNPITTQVCAFWREVAEATPILWTDVSINLEVEEQDGLERVAQMDARMKRAKQHLMAVEFLLPKKLAQSRTEWWDPPNPKPPQVRHFIAAVTTLLKYRDHVGSLDIPCHEPNLGGYLVTKCATGDVTFKNLHTLSLYEGLHYTLHETFDPEPLLKACPNVNRLRIFQAPDTPYIHWEKMKVFKGALESSALSTFLSRAQDVEQAEISCFHWDLASNITFSPRLTALSLHRISASCATRLATVPCPSSLRYLSLSAITEDFASASSGLLPLLRSWGPEIEFLALLLNITAKDLKSVLQLIPNIRCLRISLDRPTPPNFFNLVPHLTHLELCGSVEEHVGQRAHKLLSRPLTVSSRSKRLPLRGVSFLPGIVEDLWFRDNIPHDDVRPWEVLTQDLKAVGIQVHEFRSLTGSSASRKERGFDTPFFEERGWSV